MLGETSVIINKLIFALAFLFLISCSETKDATLENFVIVNDVFESGKSLVDLSFGLHELEEKASEQSILLVGVHGNNSRGYEWVYPLQKLNNDKNLVSFFRWDDDNCPDPSIISLLELIKDKLVRNPSLNKVILVGHSYGGLLVTALSNSWDVEVLLEIHSIAGPLKGLGPISSFCNYTPPTSLKAGITLYQWRTIQDIDGAFKDLNYDPQIVSIEDSIVTRLPETYRGNKLGHNWSISWVADEINKTN